ncbi:MAG: helix-turn-helix domain-containing protein, partial [Terrimicrobiaceae bacterium]
RGRQEPFGRFVDESQKRIPLRLLDIAVEKVDPAFAPMVNADQLLAKLWESGKHRPQVHKKPEMSPSFKCPKQLTRFPGRSKKSPVTVTTHVEPLFLNIAQLAEALPASRRSVDNWKRWGWIPYYKIGGMIRFDLAAVRAALEKRFLVHAPAPVSKSHKTAKAAAKSR